MPSRSLCSCGCVLSLVRVQSEKEKENSYKVDKEDTDVITFFIFLSGYLFVNHFLELPDVMANRTEHYQGACELIIMDFTNPNYQKRWFLIEPRRR